MHAPAVSVIVASQGRPKWLARCLTALGQLDYPNFEIVIVADQEGRAAVEAHNHRQDVKLISSDVANISQTRNTGVANASGDIFAFIDDDAVPEPMWLFHHVRALEATASAASVGYVRGRNGISFQSRGQSIDCEGETRDISLQGTAPYVPDLGAGEAVKLVGTNFAVRREVVDELGGFDESFRFFLDDSDLSLRLSQSGHPAVIVPLAEVHHAFAASVRRSKNRFPKRLFDIGRSTAIFARKHNPHATSRIQLRMIEREQIRLEAHMVRGNCEPRDVRRGMEQLDAGWRDGLTFSGPISAPKRTKSNDFKLFSPKFRGHQVVQSRFFGRSASIQRAQGHIAQGQRASVFSFSLTARPHRVQFTDSGIWVQSGGQFGRSDRSGPFWRWCRFAQRYDDEVTRVEMQRWIGEDSVVWGNEQ